MKKKEYSVGLTLPYYDEETEKEYEEREQDFVDILIKDKFCSRQNIVGFHDDVGFQVENGYWMDKTQIRKLVKDLHSIDENIYIMIWDKDDNLSTEDRIAELDYDEF